jgi:hypothetical protein
VLVEDEKGNELKVGDMEERQRSRIILWLDDASVYDDVNALHCSGSQHPQTFCFVLILHQETVLISEEREILS